MELLLRMFIILRAIKGRTAAAYATLSRQWDTFTVHFSISKGREGHFSGGGCEHTEPWVEYGTSYKLWLATAESRFIVRVRTRWVESRLPDVLGRFGEFCVYKLDAPLPYSRKWRNKHILIRQTCLPSLETLSWEESCAWLETDAQRLGCHYWLSRYQKESGS